jgi:hypothetical protein
VATIHQIHDSTNVRKTLDTTKISFLLAFFEERFFASLEMTWLEAFFNKLSERLYNSCMPKATEAQKPGVKAQFVQPFAEGPFRNKALRGILIPHSKLNRLQLAS